MYKPYTLTSYDDRAISCINEMFQMAFTELGIGTPEIVSRDNAGDAIPKLFKRAYMEANKPMLFPILEVDEETIPVIDLLFTRLFLEI